MPSRLSVNNFFIFLLFATSFTLQAAIPNSALVGQTSGSFSVSPSGTASYSIPIQLPPNVGAVQPNLTLSYDNSAGNGLLGVGWNLSGLSSISRCPTTLERDGYIDGVDFDTNDQFCLDGQRLVNISGSEYRAELDDFSKITGGVNGFTVVTSSGLTMHYGTTPNTRIQLKGNSIKIISWVLYKVEDMYGNAYIIEYENNGLMAGEYFAKTIKMYGGKTLLSHVDLIYELRPDIISGFQSGSRYQITQRLKAVKTYTRSILTKQYLINYADQLEPSNISYLESVAECDASSQCLTPVFFQWGGDYSDGFIANSLPVTAKWGSSHFTWPGDFNGDGLTDIASATGGNIYMKLSKGDGFTSEDWSVTANWGNAPWTWTGDFNGDGLLDIASASGSNVYMKLSEGNRFRSETWVTTALWGSDGYNWAEDFNGDGLTDIASVANGNVYIKLSTGTGFASKTYSVTAQWGSSPWTWVGDFNGDGLLDFASASGTNV
jgi:hypothetical protein